MTLGTPAIFNETNARSGHFAAVVALVLAVPALWVSPDLSLMNLAVSLAAVLLSFLTSLNYARRWPRGILGVWVIVLGALWLSPWAGLSLDSKRMAFALAAVYYSLVFQGPRVVFFAVLLVSFGVCLRDLSGQGLVSNFASFVRADSFEILLAALVLATTIFFARVAHTRAVDFLVGLRKASTETEKSRVRLVVLQENVQLTRERFLGRTLTSGESLIGDLPAETEIVHDRFEVAFDEVIRELRQIFSDYQMKGRADGRISGPIRFVFFAPVAGYDEKSVIAVEMPKLREGIEACLTLALESLPEIGARKREGVIRLSLRYGLRMIEVAVEDNGRGLTSRNLQAENDLVALKILVDDWGGKFDRLARLGVGSRTSLELRIVRERARVFRTPASRDFTSGGVQAEDVPRG